MASSDLMNLVLGAQLFNACVGAVLGLAVLAQCGKKKDEKKPPPPSAVKKPGPPPPPTAPAAPALNKDAEQKTQSMKDEKKEEKKEEEKKEEDKKEEEKKDEKKVSFHIYLIPLLITRFAGGRKER